MDAVWAPITAQRLSMMGTFQWVLLVPCHGHLTLQQCCPRPHTWCSALQDALTPSTLQGPPLGFRSPGPPWAVVALPHPDPCLAHHSLPLLERPGLWLSPPGNQETPGFSCACWQRTNVWKSTGREVIRPGEEGICLLTGSAGSGWL